MNYGIISAEEGIDVSKAKDSELTVNSDYKMFSAYDVGSLSVSTSSSADTIYRESNNIDLGYPAPLLSYFKYPRNSEHYTSDEWFNIPYNGPSHIGDGSKNPENDVYISIDQSGITGSYAMGSDIFTEDIEIKYFLMTDNLEGDIYKKSLTKKYGVKSSKEGSVKYATDRNISFSSGYEIIQYYESEEVNIPSSDSFTDWKTIEINHGLGYIPGFMAYWNQGLGYKFTPVYFTNPGGSTQVAGIKISVDSEKMYIRYLNYDTNTEKKFRDITVLYNIFTNKLSD